MKNLDVPLFSYVINILNNIEKEFPVQSWRAFDFCVWPMLRNQIGLEIIKKGLDHPNKPQKGNEDSRIRRVLSFPISLGNSFIQTKKASFLDRIHNEAPKTAQVLFLGLNLERQLQLSDNRRMDVHCDLIVEKLNLRGITTRYFEWNPLHRYLFPRYGNTKFIQDRIDWSKVLGMIRYQLNSHQCPNFNDYNKLREQLRTQYCITNIPSIQYWQSYFFFINELSCYFQREIINSKVRIGFVADYASSAGMAFVLACRRNGIPSVDIQHGAAGDSNHHYGGWSCIPPNGFEVLPSFFWCWSEDEALSINNWSHNASEFHRPLVGGNPYLAYWNENKHDNIFEHSHDRLNPTHITKNILLALQFEVCIPEHVLALFKKSPSNWKWWIRHHPCSTNQERNSIEDLLLSQGSHLIYDIHYANELPVVALLDIMDIVVTQWSAIILEAKNMGVKSVLTHTFGRDLFQKEIDSGFAILALDTETLKEIIDDTSKKSIYDKGKAINDSKLMEQAIDKLVKEYLP